MSNRLVTAARENLVVASTNEQSLFVTFTVADQLFGIRVLQVQDILKPQKITPVPLAPPEILGSLNLRGRIVIAIDMRVRLGLPPRPISDGVMSIVVEHNGELCSLVVDRVGEVINLSSEDFEKNPATLTPQWREFSQGIYRLKEYLLVMLDVAKLLHLNEPPHEIDSTITREEKYHENLSDRR